MRPAQTRLAQPPSSSSACRLPLAARSTRTTRTPGSRSRRTDNESHSVRAATGNRSISGFVPSRISTPRLGRRHGGCDVVVLVARRRLGGVLHVNQAETDRSLGRRSRFHLRRLGRDRLRRHLGRRRADPLLLDRGAGHLSGARRRRCASPVRQSGPGETGSAVQLAVLSSGRPALSVSRASSRRERPPHDRRSRPASPRGEADAVERAIRRSRLSRVRERRRDRRSAFRPLARRDGGRRHSPSRRPSATFSRPPSPGSPSRRAARSSTSRTRTNITSPPSIDRGARKGRSARPVDTSCRGSRPMGGVSPTLDSAPARSMCGRWIWSGTSRRA